MVIRVALAPPAARLETYQTAFGFTVQQATPTAMVTMRIPGKAQTGTFTDATAGVELVAAASATAGNPPPTWMVQMNPKMGSLSLTIADLGAGITGPNGGVAYPDPHGTATATLAAIAETKASGTVNLKATF